MYITLLHNLTSLFVGLSATNKRGAWANIWWPKEQGVLNPQCYPKGDLSVTIHHQFNIATTLAAMLPFFGDINAVIGAFWFLPLDFILPVLFFNFTFKPSKRSPIFWLNATIAVVFSIVGVIAAVAAVRQISIDAKTYRLFANVWSY